MRRILVSGRIMLGFVKLFEWGNVVGVGGAAGQ
jgi:hypothetical protein